MNPPSAASGDFRFQGGWRDQQTGLVQFGVRDYDPRIGQFLTQDPAPPDFQDPTTIHPYAFADNNPLFFSDPTGLFTFSEINVTLSTKGVMSSLRTGVKVALKQKLKEEIGEALTDVFVRFLDQTVGMGLQDFIFKEVGFDKLKPWELGNMFEQAVRETVCEWFPINSSWLWFEPGVSEADGRAISNGVSCADRETSVGRKKKTRYPDMVIKRVEPRSRAEKTMITAEFKLGIGTFYRAWIDPGDRRKQFEAFTLHSRNYGYPPHVVFVLSLKRGKKSERKQIQRELRRQRVRGWVRTLF